MMRTTVAVAVLLFALSHLGPVAAAQEPPSPAPVRPVSEQLYGQTITDPYQYMEDLQSPEVQSLMKAESVYTQAMLNALPGRQDLENETLAAVKTSPPQFREFQRRASRVFYMKRMPGEQDYKLYLRTLGKDDEKLVCDPATFAEDGAGHIVLLNFAPSNQGDLVTVSLARGGSETATIHVLDAATGKDHADRIARDRFHAVNWLPDDAGFTYSQLQEMRPGMKPEDRQKNSTVRLHRLGTDSEADPTIVSAAMLGFDPALFPEARVMPGSHYAVLNLTTGVSPTDTIYVAPADEALKGNKAAWKKLADPADGIYDFATRGDEMFLVSGKNSPNFRVLRLSMAQADLSAATEMVAEQPNAFVSLEQPGSGVMAASDALYVAYVEAGSSRLGRIGYEPGSRMTLASLPTASSLATEYADPRVPGVLVQVNTWTAPPEEALVDGKGTQPLAFTAGAKPAGLDLVVEQVEVAAKDGAKIPLTILYNKGFARDGSRPLLMVGYGAYGTSALASFSPSRVPWLMRGYGVAVAHVRGGGERGEAWHLAGYKETKHNTWEDAIACAEHLVREKYTSPAHLSLFAGSAGGILAGRSLEERPNLFAAVVDAVPMSDFLELRRDPNGPDQKAEFGWSDTEAGYRSLMAMSSYHHIVPGTKYPAVLFITGANDPRVSPAQPMKMTARLRSASTSGKPVLLRVDYDAGHNANTMTLQQQVAMTADIESFILWQTGVDGFQPARK